MDEVDLIANAAFGLEAIVHRELRGMGFDNITVEDGRLRFRGLVNDICRLNIWLRTAERVQIVAGDFPARDFDELFDHTKELPWERWLGVDAAFPVNARSVRSQLRSLPNIQKMVKRAIVERMRKLYVRHWFAETGPTYEIDVSLLNDRALLTIDTTGAGLHKRGYRPLVGDAPLRETLAAGILLLSYWNKERQLIDPFCGTGTIAIEAALIGRNMAPGRHRDFAAEQWPQIPASVWTDVRRQARDAIGPPLSIPVLASDIDQRALKLARQNAEAAGVASDISLIKRPFIEFQSSRDFGCVVTNPPYGERLGTPEEVTQLHHELGQILTMYETWSHYIISAAPRFEYEFGRRADRRRKLFNGRIECTLYQYLGPRPPWEEPRFPAPAAQELPDPLPTDPAEQDAPANDSGSNPPPPSIAGEANFPHSDSELSGDSSSPVAQEPVPQETISLPFGMKLQRPLAAPAPPRPTQQGSEMERRMAAKQAERNRAEQCDT